MRKITIVAALFAVALAGHAQEPVMKVHKKDGTTALTRAAELKQLSFLTLDEGGKGLLVKTAGGTAAAVLFEARPVVTIANGKLTVTAEAAEASEFEIADIEEIVFGDVADATAVRELHGFACVLQDGAVVLRGLPQGARPHVYALDGRSLPTPPLQGGELRLSRAQLGRGVFIVKVGSFSTKIKL